MSLTPITAPKLDSLDALSPTGPRIDGPEGGLSQHELRHAASQVSPGQVQMEAFKNIDPNGIDLIEGGTVATDPSRIKTPLRDPYPSKVSDLTINLKPGDPNHGRAVPLPKDSPAREGMEKLQQDWNKHKGKVLSLLKKDGAEFGPESDGDFSIIAVPGLREKANGAFMNVPNLSKGSSFTSRGFKTNDILLVDPSAIKGSSSEDNAGRLAHEAIHKFGKDTGRYRPGDPRSRTESEIRAHAFLVRHGDTLNFSKDFRTKSHQELRRYLTEQMKFRNLPANERAAELQRIKTASPAALANRAWQDFGYHKK